MAPPSNNAFDSDDEDDDLDDEDYMEGMTMSILSLSVFSFFFLTKGKSVLKIMQDILFPSFRARVPHPSWECLVWLTFIFLQFAEVKKSSPRPVRRCKQLLYVDDSDSDEDSADEFGIHPRHTAPLYLLWWISFKMNVYRKIYSMNLPSPPSLSLSCP